MSSQEKELSFFKNLCTSGSQKLHLIFLINLNFLIGCEIFVSALWLIYACPCRYLFIFTTCKICCNYLFFYCNKIICRTKRLLWMIFISVIWETHLSVMSVVLRVDEHKKQEKLGFHVTISFCFFLQLLLFTKFLYSLLNS